MNLVLLNTHDIFPADISGGIEKRIEAFVNFLNKESIPIKVISSKKIDYKDAIYIDSISQEDFVSKGLSSLNKDDKVISYNLTADSCKLLNNKNVRTINANCGGMAKGSTPSQFLYSSDIITNRFLSFNQKQSYNGFYDEKNTCIISHGLNEDEFYLNKDNQRMEYFLWCASLGWGWQAKGLDIFIKLAQLNPTERFKVYGAKWNSDSLENHLKNLNMPNVDITFGLKDEEKNEVFSNAIALCQFTRLIESCNIVTLESYSRGTPVITLDEDQGGVTNNAKFFDLTLKSFEDFISLKQKALLYNREEIYNYYKNNFHCRNEYQKIIEEFKK